MNLDVFVKLRKRLEESEYDGIIIKGKIFFISKEDISLIKQLRNYVDEIFYDNKLYIEDNIKEIVNKNITITLRPSGINNYFEKFEDFVSGNKIECKLTQYYIHELNYFEGKMNIIPPKISSYKQNLKLIELLTKIANDINNDGKNNRKLFFYTTSGGVSFNINYSTDDLEYLNLENFSNLNEELSNNGIQDEKKRLFINELINFSQNKTQPYQEILKNWSIIYDSFMKNYGLFLEGFSFEKIKTNSIEYFHKLTDRIYSTISKVSNYIFAIPVAYIFLISKLDFSGKSLVKDSLIIILGTLFFSLMWFVFFRNIKEFINEIERDINNYATKIKGYKNLKEVYFELMIMRDKTIKKQRNKLLIVRIISIVILLITFFAFFYIHEVVIYEYFCNVL